MISPTSSLSDLLAPISIEEFIHTYWQCQPLYLKGKDKKFASLFSYPELLEALAGDKESSSSGFILGMFAESEVVEGLTNMELIYPEEISSQLDSGRTICISGLGKRHPSLQQFAERLLCDLNCCGSAVVNCYLSANGSGAKMHLDARMTLSLQLSGHKIWRYSCLPALDCPRSNAQILRNNDVYWVLPWAGEEAWEKIDAPSLDTLHEITMAPGDLLYLPAGTWHTACAVGESLAVNLALLNQPFYDVIPRLLVEQFLYDADWRRGVPASHKEFVKDTIPANVETFIRERLTQAGLYLTSLSKAPTDELYQIWQQLIR